MASNTHSKPTTVREVFQAITTSNAKIEYVADGRAMDLAADLKRMGTQQVSIIVLK
jgi:hypothetical protein